MKPLLISLAFLLLLTGVAVAVDVACGTALNSPGTTYTLNASSSINGSTCFNVSVANVTVDCMGWSITGNNTVNTYGIYSTKSNTTIKNCVISNFATGIYFLGATNGAIDRTNVSTLQPVGSGNDGYGIYLDSGSNYNRITNIKANVTTGGRAISLASNSNNTLSGINATSTSGKAFIFSASVNNTLSNSTATTIDGVAIHVVSVSNFNVFSNLISASTNTGNSILVSSGSNNTFSNITTSAASGNAMYLTGSSNNTLSNINATGTAALGVGLFLTSISNFNVISNLTATATNYAIRLGTNSDKNTFSNITATVTTGTGIDITTSSNSNNISKLNVIATQAGGKAIYISGSTSNIIANSTATSNNTAIIILTAISNSNIIRNTTMISLNRTGLLLNISSDSGLNTFCLNNFTNTSSNYVTDLNGSNSYNCTYDGKNQGNVWYDVINGSVAVAGGPSSSIPNLYIGTRESGVPYNITKSSKFSCNFVGCADYAPLTNRLYYQQTTDITSSGGALLASAAYRQHVIIGDIAGPASSTNYKTRLGFLAGSSYPIVTTAISDVASQVRFKVGVPPSFCVAPTNQTALIGIYNVTVVDGPADIYAMINDTFPCFNVTMSSTNACSAGMNLTTSPQTFINTLNGQAYLWAFANSQACLDIPPKFNITIGG